MTLPPRVTQEYVDLTTRIRVLKETQTQLIALLKQARNVEEALQVRRSLDAITMELEQAMGRLRMLENLIGFSTLTLRLSERGPQNATASGTMRLHAQPTEVAQVLKGGTG